MFPNPIINGIVIFVMSDLACCLTESYSANDATVMPSELGTLIKDDLAVSILTTVGPLLICAWTLLLFNQRHYFVKLQMVVQPCKSSRIAFYNEIISVRNIGNIMTTCNIADTTSKTC